jgi:hypothetical protein
MCEALGLGVIAIGNWDLIAFAQLLASGDHPVGEVEHGSFKATGSVRVGSKREFLKPNLFEFFRDSLSVIFGCQFILKVIHLILLWRKPYDQV